MAVPARADPRGAVRRPALPAAPTAASATPAARSRRPRPAIEEVSERLVAALLRTPATTSAPGRTRGWRATAPRTSTPTRRRWSSSSVRRRVGRTRCRTSELADVLEALGDVCDIAGSSRDAVVAYRRARHTDATTRQAGPPCCSRRPGSTSGSGAFVTSFRLLSQARTASCARRPAQWRTRPARGWRRATASASTCRASTPRRCDGARSAWSRRRSPVTAKHSRTPTTPATSPACTQVSQRR